MRWSWHRWHFLHPYIPIVTLNITSQTICCSSQVAIHLSCFWVACSPKQHTNLDAIRVHFQNHDFERHMRDMKSSKTFGRKLLCAEANPELKDSSPAPWFQFQKEPSAHLQSRCRKPQARTIGWKLPYNSSDQKQSSNASLKKGKRWTTPRSNRKSLGSRSYFLRTAASPIPIHLGRTCLENGNLIWQGMIAWVPPPKTQNHPR